MFCWKCGSENADTDSYCRKCGTLMQVAPPGEVTTPRIEDDPIVRLLLPIGRSGWAVAAGYAGLFAILLLPAPLAILCGVLALRDIKRNPKKFGKGRAIFGIVMGVLGTLGLACVGLAWILAGSPGVN